MGTFDNSRIKLQSILEVCLKTHTVNEFEKAVSNFKSVVDQKSLVDQVFHNVLLDLQNNSNKETNKYKSFIEFCIEVCKKNLATENLPVVLLSDIFETLTILLCQEYFGFVEDKILVWKDPQFYGPCKNHLLRMCNGLLSRLSREKDAIFCGRILIFLSKLLPFCERSGLNLASSFNDQNFDEFERRKAVRILKDMQEDEDEKTVAVYSFFKSYLMIKSFLRNPNLCFDKVEWTKFEKCLSRILDYFDKNKIEVENYEDSKKFLKEIEISAEQLQSSKFRRQILVQFLILFQYLNGTVKFKTETQKLDALQSLWIEGLSKEVYNLLSETFPEGDKFAKMVKSTMKNEELWIDWKNNGCPAFKKPIEDTKEDLEKRPPKKMRRNIGDILKKAEATGRCYMAKPELTELWNLPDNMEICKSEERDFLPGLKEFFKEAAEELNPEEMVEEQYRKTNNEKFRWVGLKLLSVRCPTFFNTDTQPKQLSSYLEKMIKTIY